MYAMLKKCSLAITLIMTLSLTGCNKSHIAKFNTNICSDQNLHEFSLANYRCYSASVLPTITENDELYAILSREAYGRKHKFGKLHKYDDFSGSRDEGENHPIETAAHEFLQEAILAGTLRWNLDQTIEFLKPENNNTWAIIVYSAEANPNIPHIRKARNVTYLTHFDSYKNRFFRNFHNARRKEVEQYKKEGVSKSHWTNAEKDRLAKVKWSDLKTAIINQDDPNEIVEVEALVMNPRTRRFTKQMIQLRPFLVIKLRPYFLDQDYKKGENEKIRLYCD
jgi:hypothetical protein